MATQQDSLCQYSPLSGWIHYADTVIEVRRFVVMHILHRFDGRRSPAPARPTQEKRRPHWRVEQAHISESQGIPDTPIMECFHLRLHTILLRVAAIGFQLTPIMDAV